jgi:hypothetical protein
MQRIENSIHLRAFKKDVQNARLVFFAYFVF